jgi:hypothetical protein
VTNNEKIWKVPFTYDLGADDPPTPLISAGISSSDSSYNHIGDPDQSSEFLFVPLEGDNRPGRIAVYDTTDLRHLSSADLPLFPVLDRRHGSSNKRHGSPFGPAHVLCGCPPATPIMPELWREVGDGVTG